MFSKIDFELKYQKVFKKKYLIFLMGVLFPLQMELTAQDSTPIVNRSETIQVVDGKEYFFHAVLQGQTLFSIARAYGVSIEDIINANPELREQELRFDQIIKIPVRQHEDPRPAATTIKETTWIEHQVRRRETVYGISRQYDITQEQLLQNNPHARTGLRPNMILRIPREVERIITFTEYTVPPGQTLFSLSREFNISIEELEKYNPELKEGLKAGQTIRIPAAPAKDQQPPFVVAEEPAQIIPDYTPVPEKTDEYCHDPILKESYNVALLIPLYLERIQEEEEDLTDPRHPSFTFMEYYQGMLIAMDSIRKMGADISLTVYDVCDRPEKARAVLRKPEMRNMDLIIGPFFPGTLRIVAEFAGRNNVPVISPLHWEDNKMLASFPNLFQATPSMQTQMNDMALYVAKNYPDDNIILIHNNQPGVMHLIQGSKNVLNRELNYREYYRDSINLAKINGFFLNGVYVGERLTNVYVLNDSLLEARQIDDSVSQFEQYLKRDNVKEFIYGQGGMEKLRNHLDTNRRNILLSLMGGEAIISDFTRQLNQIRDTFDIKVFGVPQWRDYRSLDFRVLQNLRVHLFKPDFIDYENPNNIDFIRRFRQQNHTEPGERAFKAVNTGMFFFTALMQYGTEFPRCMNLINQGNSSNSPFWFERAHGPDSGWENKHVYLIRYQNFRLIDVKQAERKVATMNQQ